MPASLTRAASTPDTSGGIVVIDAGIEHYPRTPANTCAGCNQRWPCYVAMLHGDPEAAPDPVPVAPLLAVVAAALVVGGAVVWLALAVVRWLW